MNFDCLTEGFRRQLFTEVLSVIERYDTRAWMWWCSNERKRMIFEHGAVQHGYTDYDDDLEVYKNVLRVPRP